MHLGINVRKIVMKMKEIVHPSRECNPDPPQPLLEEREIDLDGGGSIVRRKCLLLSKLPLRIQEQIRKSVLGKQSAGEHMHIHNEIRIQSSQTIDRIRCSGLYISTCVQKWPNRWIPTC
jgi:hypothetical protein